MKASIRQLQLLPLKCYFSYVVYMFTLSMYQCKEMYLLAYTSIHIQRPQELAYYNQHIICLFF